MNLQIGASGFNYPAWVGAFYPDDLPEEWAPGYYANEFRTVMLDDETFARDLKRAPDMLDDLGEGFCLVLPDSALNRHLLARNDSAPRVIFYQSTAGCQQDLQSFVLTRYPVKAQDADENSPLVFAVSSDSTPDIGQWKQLIGYIGDNYAARDSVFLFVTGSLLQPAPLKTLKTLGELMAG